MYADSPIFNTCEPLKCEDTKETYLSAGYFFNHAFTLVKNVTFCSQKI